MKQIAREKMCQGHMKYAQLEVQKELGQINKGKCLPTKGYVVLMALIL